MRGSLIGSLLLPQVYLGKLNSSIFMKTDEKQKAAFFFFFTRWMKSNDPSGWYGIEVSKQNSATLNMP